MKYGFTNEMERSAHLEEIKRRPWIAALAPGDWGTKYGLGAVDYFVHGPSALNIMLGDRCNSECRMCWQALARAQTKQGGNTKPWRQTWPDLEPKIIYETLAKYPSVRSVELCSFGEPLLHPEIQSIIPQIARDVGENGVLHMVSNGSMLKRAEVLLHIPGNLTLSIDGADKKTYESIRRGLSWDTLTGNLRWALQVRIPERLIGINFTIIKENLGSIEDIGRFAFDSGIDYITYLLGDNMKETLSPESDVKHELDKIQSRISVVRQDYSSSMGVNDRTSPATSATPSLAEVEPLPFCLMPWKQIDIDPRGRAHPCCRSYHTNLGAVSKAWHGKQMAELRNQLRSGRLDSKQFKDCAKCGRLGAKVQVI